MYDKSGPFGNDATFWAIQKLQILENNTSGKLNSGVTLNCRGCQRFTCGL